VVPAMSESERHAGLDPTGKWTAGALSPPPNRKKQVHHANTRAIAA